MTDPTTLAPHRDLLTPRKGAERMRSEWLLSLGRGYISPTDLIDAAASDDHRPLRRLTLRRILRNTPGWNKPRIQHALAQMRAVLGVNTPSSRMTVNWLLDSRANGRRVQAWTDAVTDLQTPPWPGFPYAPQPTTEEAT